MGRCIDEDKLLQRFTTAPRNAFSYAAKEVVAEIKSAQTADVAPVVHGRWLAWEEKFPGKTPTRKNNLGVFCIVCGNHADNRHNFCPSCGARMDGVK